MCEPYNASSRLSISKATDQSSLSVHHLRKSAWILFSVSIHFGTKCLLCSLQTLSPYTATFCKCDCLLPLASILNTFMLYVLTSTSRPSGLFIERFKILLITSSSLNVEINPLSDSDRQPTTSMTAVRNHFSRHLRTTARPRQPFLLFIVTICNI